MFFGSVLGCILTLTQVLAKGANYAPLPPHTIHPDTTHILLQNEIPLPTTLEFLAHASSTISTILNPSPMPAPEQLKMFSWDKLTWLIVNSGEAAGLCKALDLDVHETDATAAVEVAKPLVFRLSSHMPTTNIVCTLGADGVLAKFCSLDSEPIYLPAAKLQGTTRDTTGAGDCFTGYMVAGLMRLEGREPSREDYISVLRRCVQVGFKIVICSSKRNADEYLRQPGCASRSAGRWIAFHLQERLKPG